MPYFQKYNIPEYITPQSGLTTPEDGHFYFGDYSDGFEFPAKKVEPHRHPYFEIFWFPNPSGSFLSDFRIFPLSGPCLVFVSPGQVHGWPDGQNLKGCMLAFDETFTHGSNQALVRSPLFYEADTSPVVKVSAPDETLTLWNLIAGEFAQERPDKTIALESLLGLVLVSAHRMALAEQLPQASAPSASARVYQSFIKLLSEDIPEQRLAKHFAQQLGITSDYLSECVRQNCGHSAGDLIQRRVLLESKRLLAHSDLTISEIAYHLHFKDPSYFSRFFKRNTALLPKEFRDAAQSNS